MERDYDVLCHGALAFETCHVLLRECMYVCMYVGLAVCLSICLSVRPSVCLSVCMYVGR